jgi:hypothetical protein
MAFSRFRPIRFATLAAVAAGLCACQPPRPAVKDPAAADAAALELRGYTQAPEITGIATGGSGFAMVNGNAPADSRVRFAFTEPLKGGTQAVGVTTDGQGHFHAEVPVTAGGGLYDITVDDGGRPRQAEGRLFIPPGRPDKAVLLRPGTASRLLQSHVSGVMVADYDAAGAFALSGRVAPDADVTVIVNNEIRAEVRSDGTGQFAAVTQVPEPGPVAQTVSVIVQADMASFKRDVQVVAMPASAGDRVTTLPDAWRADWKLPGGGGQSTLVFKN